MEPFATDPIQIWALSAVFLFFKMYSNSLAQGFATFKAKRFYFSEDAKLLGNGAPVNREETDLQTRANTCWENDLENIPIFLFISLAYALVVNDHDWSMRFAIAFCVSRVVHAVALLNAKQPWRNLAYQVGILTCIAMSVGIVRKIYFS